LGVTRPGYAKGLIEVLQAIAPEWSSKLTMERLSFVQALSERHSRVGVLEEAIKEMVDAGPTEWGDVVRIAEKALGTDLPEKDSPDGN
jgi:hypothetical protein